MVLNQGTIYPQGRFGNVRNFLIITTRNESYWHLVDEARMLLNILWHRGQPPTIPVNSAKVQKPWHSTAPWSEDLVLGVFLIPNQGMKLHGLS